MTTLRLLAACSLLLLGGCAARAPQSLATSSPAAPDCSAHFAPGEALALSADPLQPTRHRIEVEGPCAGVALFRLPRFRQDWTLDVASAFDGEQLYAPRAQLLDAEGRVTRELSFDRFALRGDRLQATLFFDEESSRNERYLRLLPAREVLGQGGRRVVSGSFVVPLINTVLPLVYVQGTESERPYVYAAAGVVHLAAQDAQLRRRHAPAHELARGELAALGR